MRTALLLTCLASPAFAWDTRIDGGLCILEHSAPALDLVMTYDPTGPLYTIALRRDEAWPEGAVFSMVFEGGAALTISTSRHVLDDGGQTLSVSDTGFGNVLDGLAFNEVARARVAEADISFDLDGAAPAIQAFRTCTDASLA